MPLLTLVSETNKAVGSHFSGVINMSGFLHLAMQLRGEDSVGSGIAFKVWGTLDKDAPVPNDLASEPSKDWSDVTLAFLGQPSVLIGEDDDQSELYVSDTDVMLTMYIVQYTNTSTTNTIKVLIRKY